MSDAAQVHGEDCPVCENRRELKRLAEGMEPYTPSAASVRLWLLAKLVGVWCWWRFR